MADDEPDGTTNQARLLRRQIFQLSALILIVVTAFFATRALAASNRSMRLADGAEWYARGQRQMAHGDIPRAVDAFRRATVASRTDTRYVLALARALALDGQNDAARRALLTLRETAPEDVGINLALARLAADGGDVTTASRYYHNALYAPWRDDQAAARRAVRIELVDVLLAHERVAPALSELLVLSANLPDDPALQREVARRFAAAGDLRHALDEFERALRTMPDDAGALAGAGQAALALGDYARARRYLDRKRQLPRAHASIEVLIIADGPLLDEIAGARNVQSIVAAQLRLIAIEDGKGQILDVQANPQPNDAH